MTSAVYSVGDMIQLRNERGIVVHADPPIMRTIGFHSYVPILSVPHLLERGAEADAQPPNPGVVERIRQYISRREEEAAVVPTGFTSA